MKVSWKVSLAAGALAGLWIVGVALAARPAAQEQPRMRDSIVGKKAGVYFKNVSTSTLKELSVDDFIGAGCRKLRVTIAYAFFQRAQLLQGFGAGLRRHPE